MRSETQNNQRTRGRESDIDALRGTVATPLCVCVCVRVLQNNKITRLRRECTVCGAATFMAIHYDRYTCGKSVENTRAHAMPSTCRMRNGWMELCRFTIATALPRT